LAHSGDHVRTLETKVRARAPVGDEEPIDWDAVDSSPYTLLILLLLRIELRLIEILSKP